MEWTLTNWWWLSPLVLTGLGGLKLLAKKTDWVWDDKILTLIIGFLRLAQGKNPIK